MKLFKLTSPLGIALTVAGVVLALSPEARKATRRAVVKGTAALLGAVDTVKQVTAETVDGAKHTMIETREHVIEPAAHILTETAGQVMETTRDVMINTVENAGEITAEANLMQ